MTFWGMSASEMRDEENGRLPSYAWPGGYPLVYVTEDGLTVCPECANEPDTSDPVAYGDVYWEGPLLPCDDCGEMMESAYGDPDEMAPPPDYYETERDPEGVDFASFLA